MNECLAGRKSGEGGDIGRINEDGEVGKKEGCVTTCKWVSTAEL